LTKNVTKGVLKVDELTRKINMWRIALEERNANMGIMQVFDSMLAFMGEQQRENERLRNKNNRLIKEYGVEVVLD
jgi:carbamoylphosphate synthase large subunit